MPAGEAAESMVHLGFVGQANMCVGHRQQLFLFFVIHHLNKMFCCSGENLSRVCSLGCFLSLHVCIQQEAPPFYISTVNMGV